MKITKAPCFGGEGKGLHMLCAGGMLLFSFSSSAAEAEGSRSSILRDLGETTVIANRVLTNVDKVANSVSILDALRLDRQGVRELDDALKLVPGIISDTSSGQRGMTSSVFTRGNDSAYTGILVDGFRMDGKGSGFAVGNFLGSGSVAGLSRIEVLKGPQGVLYGAGSMAGVLGLSSVKGEGDFSGNLRIESGSFDTFNKNFDIQGSSGKFSYSLSLGHELTDNDLPNNSFESSSHAFRLDYDISDRFRIGLTRRGVNTDLDLPDFADSAYSLDTEVDFEYGLTTLFAEYDVNDAWSSKVSFGYYDEFYGTYDPNDARKETYRTDTSKFAVNWDNIVVWNAAHTTVAGLSFERSQYKSGEISEKRREQNGLYVNHIWDVTEAFNISGGARVTDYEEDAANGYNDDVTTWKVASSYRVAKTNTIFRASVGTGFQLPTFYQIYRRVPNNVLNPAESMGWDVGVEQQFNDGQYKAGVTYFGTRIDSSIDYIRWDDGPIYENRDGVTETSGAEVFADASFLDGDLSLRLAYTWLDRQVLPDPRFLAEHTGSLRVDYKVNDKWDVGMTSTYQGHRALYGNVLEDYAVVNLYTNYKLSENVTLSGRVDNILDKDYYHGISDKKAGEDVRPGRGAGFFGGVTISW